MTYIIELGLLTNIYLAVITHVEGQEAVSQPLGV